MTTILHLMCRPEDPVAAVLIPAQRLQPDTAVEVVDLTRPETDYGAVVEKVFAADSVEVW